LHIKSVVGTFLLINAFLGGGGNGTVLQVAAVFGLKALLILFILSTSGVLYARLRIDQLANLGWRVLAPLALVQTAITVWIGAF
jgi:NADH:ubiquinone oxidoreductase subunit H